MTSDTIYGTIVTAMKMNKCIILLPTKYNDESNVPESVISGILREIDEAFDGHTVAGTAEGAYRMEDGSIAKDPSLVVWIAVEPDDVNKLRKKASRFARILKQESIYFEVTDSEVEFIGPEADMGDA